MRASFTAVAAGLGCISGTLAALSDVPQYVLDYAPIVKLHPSDPYLPSDISAQLANTKALKNYDAIPNAPTPLTLDNLDQLNAFGGVDVYLTSKDDVTKNPTWLAGVRPDANGKTNGAVTSVVVTVQKANGILDAFYFYFYANNWGGKVLGIEFGNHVGDWEHNMVRFENGVPKAAWYSQHARGQAFDFNALAKEGKRPVAYSANGSHATYAMNGNGNHDHTIPIPVNLPFKFIITDQTGQGPRWDPLLATWFYSYDVASKAFTPYDSSFPVNWLKFEGHWGDKEYQDGDKGQYTLFGQKKYAGGPNGPAFKGLDRVNVCPGTDKCDVLGVLLPRSQQIREEEEY